MPSAMRSLGQVINGDETRVEAYRFAGSDAKAKPNLSHEIPDNNRRCRLLFALAFPPG